MSTSVPCCYDCVHRCTIPGDEHSSCANLNAVVTGNAHGMKMGWFYWPVNFDPTWLKSCDGFAPKATTATGTGLEASEQGQV